ncbi:MAG: type II methionyl aminopeptidase [Euryarchaeota archaeon]|nr:type II methionyl aminopeptidase [Euryarchaeota archaeon]
MNEEILSNLRKAGSIAREARDIGAEMIDEGVSLLEVAEEVEGHIISRGATPAFPCNLSINEIAAHYTPITGDRLKFKNGDLVKIDVGAHVDGWIGDTAVTVEVGTRNWTGLIDSAARALAVAIEIVSEGTPVNMIGGTIERVVRSNGYSPVVNLTGHGMAQHNLHAGLTVPNCDDGVTTRVEQGMILAIEPFVTDGGGEVQNSRPGNIYRVIRERKIRDKAAAEHFQLIQERFGGLPFCERWCTALDSNAPAYLRTLVRHGLIYSYPMLTEVCGGMVSQKEHTVVVRDGGAEVLT